MTSALEKLMADSPPFIITVLFSALAWWVTHTVDRVETRPLVEYEFVELSVADGIRTESLTIRNISKQLFTKLEFQILWQAAPAHFAKRGVKVIGSGWQPKAGDFSNNAVSIAMAEMHPGSGFYLEYEVSADAPRSLHLSSAKTAVELKPPGPASWLLKNETLVSASILLLLLGLLLTFLFQMTCFAVFGVIIVAIMNIYVLLIA